jgi:nicotinate phosphoribosyltransferase
MAGDVLSLETDSQDGEALLEPAMKAGRRIGPSPSLAQIRARAGSSLERLPEPLRRLDRHASYPVTIAQPLLDLAAETDRRLAARGAAS